MAVRLPVYPVSVNPRTDEETHDFVASLFGVEGSDVEQHNGALIARAGSLVVETDRLSGGVSASDHEHLWNPSRRPSLASPKKTYGVARDMLGAAALLPRFDDEAPFTLRELGVGRSIVATSSKGARTHHQLDTQARYAVMVRNPGDDGPELLPMIGGGGKVTLTLGDAGHPIGLQHAWRPAGEPELVEGDRTRGGGGPVPQADVAN